jgi:hypothetical protein
MLPVRGRDVAAAANVANAMLLMLLLLLLLLLLLCFQLLGPPGRTTNRPCAVNRQEKTKNNVS